MAAVELQRLLEAQVVRAVVAWLIMVAIPVLLRDLVQAMTGVMGLIPLTERAAAVELPGLAGPGQGMLAGLAGPGQRVLLPGRQ